MKILIIGGVKSGKSRHAEKLILAMANGIKPVYLATSELNDSEMKKRITSHRQRRGNKFETLEEPLCLARVLRKIQCPVLSSTHSRCHSTAPNRFNPNGQRRY